MIRRYAPDDTDDLLEVWDRSARVAHPFWTSESFDRERGAIEDRFLPVAETYVYEKEGRIAGFVSLMGDEVGGLFVDPHWHRHGIGRALLDHARASRDRLELDVFEANEIGRAFYDAYGFAVVGVRVDVETGLRVLRLRLPAG